MVGVAAVMCSIFLLGYTLCRSKKMLNPVGVFFIVFVLTQIGLLGARVYSVFEDVILHFKSGEPLSNYPLRDKMNSGGFSYYSLYWLFFWKAWVSTIRRRLLRNLYYLAVGYALYRWAVSEFITSTSCTHLRNDCNRHIIFLLTMAQ